MMMVVHAAHPKLRLRMKSLAIGYAVASNGNGQPNKRGQPLYYQRLLEIAERVITATACSEQSRQRHDRMPNIVSFEHMLL